MFTHLIFNRDDGMDNAQFIRSVSPYIVYEKLMVSEELSIYHETFENKEDVIIVQLPNLGNTVTFFYWNEDIQDWDIDRTDSIIT